jgi:hypothetical protein
LSLQGWVTNQAFATGALPQLNLISGVKRVKTAWSEPPVVHIVADLDRLEEEYGLSRYRAVRAWRSLRLRARWRRMWRRR